MEKVEAFIENISASENASKVELNSALWIDFVRFVSNTQVYKTRWAAFDHQQTVRRFSCQFATDARNPENSVL